MFSFQKITKLTWFDETLRAKMFTKVVNLILAGGKTRKYWPLSLYGLGMPESWPNHSITHCQWFPHQNFLETAL